MNSKEENSSRLLSGFRLRIRPLLDLQKALSVLGLGSLIDLTEVDDSSVFLGGLSFKVFLSMRLSNPVRHGFGSGSGSESGFNQVIGSGSVFGIRIRIQEGKNDPQK